MMMDIKTENIFADAMFATSEMPTSVMDTDAYPHINTEPLLSDDIWKKFEFDFPELSSVEEMFKELEDTSISEQHTLFSLLGDMNNEIRNHDCMWAGHCASKEHPADEPKQTHFVPNPPAAAAAAAIIAPVALIKAPALIKPVQGGQSLLKNAYRVTNPKTVVPQFVHTPQTPPMSDDEEGKTKNPDLVKILQETILATDDLMGIVEADDDEIMKNFSFDDDEDEEEEEEDDDEEEEEEEEKPAPKYSVPTYAADHSYHKGKNSYVLDTPSDSEEEEIDVVSVEKSFSRMPTSSLPTNPSTRVRHQLQRRMATAITRKRMSNNGLKTIMPLKKSQMTTETTTTIKRRIPDVSQRSLKRTKQYRMAPNNNNNSSPYKKRHVYGNSSDSEPEPSEKRSLHNNMERQRRIDLRNAFEDLRTLVPEVSKKERAAKVVILREAAQYCDHLGNVSHNYTKQSEDLRRQQEWLRQRVSQLRRSLAAKR